MEGLADFLFYDGGINATNTFCSYLYYHIYIILEENALWEEAPISGKLAYLIPILRCLNTKTGLETKNIFPDARG